MTRWAGLGILHWVLVGVIGCGAQQKQPRTESDRTVVDRMDQQWSPDEETWSEGETSDTPSAFSDRVDMRDLSGKDSSSGSGSGSRPAASPESSDYEMTYHDCNVLAGHYYRVILQEESGKIPDGFKPAQRSAAERAAEQSATKGKEQWEDQCAGLVGSAYKRSWLTCAMKATTVKGFTDCVTGAHEQAGGAE